MFSIGRFPEVGQCTVMYSYFWIALTLIVSIVSHPIPNHTLVHLIVTFITLITDNNDVSPPTPFNFELLRESRGSSDVDPLHELLTSIVVQEDDTFSKINIYIYME